MEQPALNGRPDWLVWITESDFQSAFNMAPRLEVTREMRKLGWKVDLIACGQAGEHVVQGVEIMAFPRPDIYLVSNLVFHLNVVRYILRNWGEIGAVLFTQLSAPWILPLRLLRFPGRPHPLLVMDTRTVPMEPDDRASLKDKLRGQLLLLMNKAACWLADGQTAITKRMAQHLAIPNKQLWGIWSSAVNTDRFRIASERRVWPAEQEPLVVIYIGTLNYERNLMTLCRAITRANQEDMDFVLWLYGEGNEKEDLKAYAQKSSGKVCVFDAVPNEQMPGILARAQVGTLPFPDEEKYRVSSPIKLFEYMGAGMPILATRIVCHTDVIGEGDFVLWAEGSDEQALFDALQKTWRARDSLPELGRNSLAASANWTWRASASRLDAALQYGLNLHQRSSAVAAHER